MTSSSTMSYILKKGSTCNISLCSISSTCFSASSTQEPQSFPSTATVQNAAPQSVLCYRAKCPKGAIAALPHWSSTDKGRQSFISPKLWPWCRLTKCSTSAELQPLSAQHVAPACASSQAPSSGMPAETCQTFPITAFTQQAPRASSRVPASWMEAYVPLWSTSTDSVLDEEIEEAQERTCASQLQHPARNWGSTNRAKTAYARYRVEECGKWGQGASQHQVIPHLETSRSQPEWCRGRKRSDVLGQVRAATLLRISMIQLPCLSSLQSLWRNFHRKGESLDWSISPGLPCKLPRPTTNTSFSCNKSTSMFTRNTWSLSITERSALIVISASFSCADVNLNQLSALGTVLRQLFSVFLLEESTSLPIPAKDSSAWLQSKRRRCLSLAVSLFTNPYEAGLGCETRVSTPEHYQSVTSSVPWHRWTWASATLCLPRCPCHCI